MSERPHKPVRESSTRSKRKAFKDVCPLCDTQLVVQHQRPSFEWILEKAHCPRCHVPARDRTHQVH